MELKLQCPLCNKKGKIEVAEEKFSNLDRGLIAINIQHITCKHNYIIYVDKNFHIRQYFAADFEIELPKNLDSQERFSMPRKEDLDVFLIKINIAPLILADILKAIFLKEKIIMLIDQISLGENFRKLWEYITFKNFNTELTVLKKKEYLDNKKEYKKDLVLDKNSIVKDKRKLVKGTDLDFENKIISNFFAENELASSLILLRNEVEKAYQLSQFVYKYLNEKQKKKDIKLLIKEIKEIHGISVSTDYLNFLFRIVEGYFDYRVPSHLKKVSKILF